MEIPRHITAQEEVYRLLIGLGMDKDRAQRAATVHTLPSLSRNHRKLESIIGSIAAERAVLEGNVSAYVNGSSDAYFALAEKIADKMGAPINPNDAPTFFSIESLRKRDVLGAQNIDTSKLSKNQHYLLRTDRQSLAYAASLIFSGSLLVKEEEYWFGKDGRGPCGKYIISNIHKQLQDIFRLLELQAPQARAEERRIMLGDVTRLQLYFVCEQAYRDQGHPLHQFHAKAQTLRHLMLYTRQ
jgi:hypothetical protein